MIIVEPEGIIYKNLKPQNISSIVSDHICNDTPVKKFQYIPKSIDQVPAEKDVPFFAPQLFWAMRNRGRIDPESIDEYIAQDGYFALANALNELSSEDIIEEMKKSGLRGRGGAGFPTYLKWQFASQASGDVKFVLCNADEGDPGAFMDRSILEADPHSVVEGMIIAAKAINANKGYIYCRTEYPLAIRRLEIAIQSARDYGLLGNNILDSGFNFDLEIYQGAGAFVCGEETALMRSIEGKRGMPRPRPPFPAHKGLWEKPTILNNVETFSNVAQIILNGGEWYSSVGTEKSKGTKVFALSGDITNIGLVEVPMGTPLRTIIYDIGGGIPNKKKFKAVQLGGPSGGCVPEQYLDLPVDYEAIAQAGAIMGSGGMIVMDESTCMVDMARFFMDFVQDESCGKCTPCREGTKRILDILDKIKEGNGEPDDLKKLEELGEIIQETSLCGLGQTAPNPVLSTLQYFRDEYEAHIYDKVCPAKKCVALLKFEIDPEKCTSCGMCYRHCPAGAIFWQKKEPAVIDKDKCIKCMTCFEKCKFDAIY
jgi:NADH-quinone oxidoreductase subunit F/NAD(P)H dehydrogenase (quinone)/NADP-reducing hydrogenase subunit HndC